MAFLTGVIIVPDTHLQRFVDYLQSQHKGTTTVLSAETRDRSGVVEIGAPVDDPVALILPIVSSFASARNAVYSFLPVPCGQDSTNAFSGVRHAGIHRDKADMCIGTPRMDTYRRACGHVCRHCAGTDGVVVPARCQGSPSLTC